MTVAPQRIEIDESATDQFSPIVKLRLLQTTDLHMHILPYDYKTLRPTPQRGLANLVGEIGALRQDGIPTLLFDTGDFLQGSPLADAAMQEQSTGIHPIADAFNTLKYDAVVLGNHDFDYGVEPLSETIKQIDCPVLSANVSTNDEKTTYPNSTIISVGTGPHRPPIRVGVVGLTTPVISLTTDDGAPAVSTADPVSTARTVVTQLKEQNADIIVALCHFGIDPDDHIENVAADIAGIEGVDVVMAGHTHETFPLGTTRGGPTIDARNGTICGKPTVMSGAFGRYLGVIDLALERRADHVAIVDQNTRLYRPTEQAEPKAFATVRPLHDATITSLQQEIARTTLPLSTAFSLIQPDLTQYLLSCARQLHMQDILKDTRFADLPFLTTAAPFSTGSRSNPNDFICIPPGPIKRSDVTAIYPFNNTAVAILRNGAQIKDWLEASALLYRPIQKGQQNQVLIDPHVPPYFFDTVFGLTYRIDVSAPPGDRISQIRRYGELVRDTDQFVLVSATNRLEQGHNIPPDDIIHVANQNSQDMLIASLKRQSPVTVPCPFVWDFAPLPDTTAVFRTCKEADVSGVDRSLVDNGVDADGFRSFTLSFGG
ncbi:MAG: 5'-nucleotidase C-terminal domain-containing protein [Yoonia sp.]|uniref:bifunctional metallophosphatase/5'-nucleotidase n=1 Tax=Yoonia sp. TaxID=2212373 RepID=UPI003264E6EF